MDQPVTATLADWIAPALQKEDPTGLPMSTGMSPEEKLKQLKALATSADTALKQAQKQRQTAKSAWDDAKGEVEKAETELETKQAEITEARNAIKAARATFLKLVGGNEEVVEFAFKKVCVGGCVGVSYVYMSSFGYHNVLHLSSITRINSNCLRIHTHTTQA